MSADEATLEERSLKMATLLLLLLLLCMIVVTRVQSASLCDEATVSRVTYAEITTSSPIFAPEIILFGGAKVLSTHTRLSNGGENTGGIFLRAPTEFQGPGGFSVKFGVRATRGGRWKFVIARDARSRDDAFMVVMDGSGGVNVILRGKQVCSGRATVFADGYAVWMDYAGFSGILTVATGKGNKRPGTPALRCHVDIWGVMNIREKWHVGVVGESSVDGGEVALVDAIRVVDAFRPVNKRDCAVYAKCSVKVDPTLCAVPVLKGVCELKRCDEKYVWDVAGDRCCAFIEKASWRIVGDLSGFDAIGDRAMCVRDRRTITFTADDRYCDL